MGAGAGLERKGAGGADLLPLAREVAVEEVGHGRDEEAAEDQVVVPELDPVHEERRGEDPAQRQRVGEVDAARGRGLIRR